MDCENGLRCLFYVSLRQGKAVRAADRSSFLFLNLSFFICKLGSLYLSFPSLVLIYEEISFLESRPEECLVDLRLFLDF